MFSSYYFAVQRLSFSGMGIDLNANDSCSPQNLIKHPVLLYGILLTATFHFILVCHYAGTHVTDFVEITDTMPLLCQLLLCILKTAIFLNKRTEFVLLIKHIHGINQLTKHNYQEFLIVQRENAKDNCLCSLYLRLVIVTGSCGVLHPVIYGLYIYFSSGDVVLVDTNKAFYFWNHSNLAGYSAVYVLNALSLYFTCAVSLSFDTLFAWYVNNIVAQFHIVKHRFASLSQNFCKLKLQKNKKQQQKHLYMEVVSCIKYHSQTLLLGEQLNHVYGEIIFIKLLIVCSEICSLIFRLSRPNDSLADVAYKVLFLCAVALQLILYCWNGQKIKDESLRITTDIYCAFDWNTVPKCYKKLLLFAMMRSRKCSHITGVFFEVDLSLYLWTFKTAGSLFTALKSLDED